MTSAAAHPAPDSISADRLMADLRQLAGYVKLSGTPEERESLEHVRGAMAASGYATEIVEHDAFISLPGAAHVTVDGRRLRAITHSMGRSSPAEGTRGRLVHVGEGTEADFAGRDLAGSILLVEGIATPGVALRATRAGAVGQLCISPHEHLHEMCLSPVWGNPAVETVGDMPAIVSCAISDADGASLREALRRGESPEVVVHAEVDTGWRRTPILVAEIMPDPDAPFILFSGHHDTWYHGVMDNGTANVTMIEVARVLAARQATWRRGLRLCFWSGHSHGRYSGSAWYADAFWDELDRRCAVHVNIDSVGGVGADILSEAGTAAELAGLAGAVIAGHSGQRHRGKRLPRAGDESFWGIGIPAMFMSLSEQVPGAVKLRHALGWWWHTPDDLLDKIDPANLARDAAIYLEVVERLLTDAVLPLDHAAQLDALRDELLRLDLPAGNALGIDRLAREVEALQAALAGMPRTDRALMALSRALVPLDYTQGDRFAHDPALPQAPWPSLDPLRRLQGARAGSDEARLMMVSARRARNRIAHALREARRAVSG